MSKKISVAIVGATGTVGQRFIQALTNHPLFEIKELVASEKSEGKRYGDIVQWKLSSKLDNKIADFTLKNTQKKLESNLVFSAIDSSVATEIEGSYRKQGKVVISNTKNYRMDENVPLLVPEINADHLGLIELQKKKYKGFIVTNPNCSTIGLALALAPLRKFKIEKVIVSTMQAISGAGYPGVASLDILDNIIPFISGEEEKIKSEPNKIFGKFNGKSIQPEKIKISPMVHRVPIIDGHLMSISVQFKTKPERAKIVEAIKQFKGDTFLQKCPSYATPPVVYFEEENRPQTRLDRDLNQGMSVSVGNLRDCEVFDYKFESLVHNTLRGAALGTILIAEYLAVRKML